VGLEIDALDGMLIRVADVQHGSVSTDGLAWGRQTFLVDSCSKKTVGEIGKDNLSTEG
jgi:hypothetical protein